MIGNCRYRYVFDTMKKVPRVGDEVIPGMTRSGKFIRVLFIFQKKKNYYYIKTLYYHFEQNISYLY